MKRLLCIICTFDTGGAETFLMKILRNIDRAQYQLDFCIMSDKTGYYEQEAASLGSRLFHIPNKSRHPLQCFKAIADIVRKNQYSCVMRVNESALSVIDLMAARCGGAKTLVMRSSNANVSSRTLRILHKLFFFLPRMVPNVKIAPSTEAAVYTFGKRQVEKKQVQFLNNGIVYANYRFDLKTRQRLQEELKIQGKFVVGHVGRFSQQKNHAFLLDVFSEIKKKKDHAVLLLVGTGDLEQDIRAQAEALGITDSVLFLGTRSDVPALLSAMDVLVFPSFFEGMPNVVIEAQASGLPCVAADTITPECNITGLVRFLSLAQDKTQWADAALSYADGFERQNFDQVFKEKGYEIQSVVDRFIRLVFERNA